MKKIALPFCQIARSFALMWCASAAIAFGADGVEQAGIVKREFTCDNPPWAECHASTILPTKDGGLLVAHFAGTKEMNPDVGIWLSRYENGEWQPPQEVANGVLTAEESEKVAVPERGVLAAYRERPIRRVAAWNPVLFRLKNGNIVLFYKLGTHPQTWWGMKMESSDEGKTWSKPERLPDGFYGPIKNKPVYLKDGTLLCPTSGEPVQNSDGWYVYFESSPDDGKTWEKTDRVPAVDIEAIQPSILFLPDGRLMAVGRTRPPKHGGFVFKTYSSDNGRTWSPLESTGLPNNNSGTDAVTLKDGSHLLIYNHTATTGRNHRTPLNLAWSPDGERWYAALTLEDAPRGEFSYPAIIQTDDGLVHIVYSWNIKKIRHVVVSPAKLKCAPVALNAAASGGESNL